MIKKLLSSVLEAIILLGASIGIFIMLNIENVFIRGELNWVRLSIWFVLEAIILIFTWFRKEKD